MTKFLRLKLLSQINSDSEIMYVQYIINSRASTFTLKNRLKLYRVTCAVYTIQDDRMDLCWLLRWGYAFLHPQKNYIILYFFQFWTPESLILHFDSNIYSILPKKKNIILLPNQHNTQWFIFFWRAKMNYIIKKSSRTSAREDIKRLQSYTNNKNKNIRQAQGNVNLQP